VEGRGRTWIVLRKRMRSRREDDEEWLSGGGLGIQGQYGD